MDYSGLLTALRAGRQVAPADAAAVVAAAGVSVEKLLADLFSGRPPRPGDPCAACQGGKLRVTNTRRRAGWIIRYMACGACGHRPPANKLCQSIGTEGANPASRPSGSAAESRQ